MKNEMTLDDEIGVKSRVLFHRYDKLAGIEIYFSSNTQSEFSVTTVWNISWGSVWVMGPAKVAFLYYQFFHFCLALPACACNVRGN